MSFYLDIGFSQLNKKGEELCGDSVEIRKGDSTIIVLSDGLGSGVKANILSRLTAKTAASMLQMGGLIEDVIETMAETLPVCKVRNIAYSTFSILQIFHDGSAYLAEFDNPPAYYGFGSSLQHLKRVNRRIGNRIIKEARFQLQEGNWLVMISDGVPHAGLGGVWNFGWGEERIGSYIESIGPAYTDASVLAGKLTEQCNRFYCGEPGDDTSVVVVRLRKFRKLTALIGPPRDQACDGAAVQKLADSKGVKVVCGGSTSLMVGRILNREVHVNVNTMSDIIPPTGEIRGIDLVTEGAITLYHTLKHLKDNLSHTKEVRDGSTLLAGALSSADEIHFIVGLAVNPVVRDPNFPAELAMKHQTVRDIAATLESMGKKVTIEHL